MRLSELIGKDIVNIQNGGRLGTVADSDLIIDLETGEIQSILLPSRAGFLSLFDRNNFTIPWSCVKKIGNEVIIVDLDDTHLNYKKFSY
ncbi:MAG TPA: YlmC/YmxH family sporulation protein [Peptococcaceae bacterium]|jgi:YlmC/YmxH family sporulation protein|nr:YlmC/YmxH family sporulation protein [Clostridia bacterium]HOB81892.1 YlmC/YmxH family sporulation protein [Peptococcaceae bacterium]HPZ71262.1 YlmC/YmxH family sporulation protein [Peptococcaceae bacterium]HQD53860.1 YlmC/YmxH family sporulation protein [Peptococcaceae bacterium]